MSDEMVPGRLNGGRTDGRAARLPERLSRPMTGGSTASVEMERLARLHPLLLSAAFHHNGPVALTDDGLLMFDN